MDFIKLQKLKDTYFSNQTISQIMTDVFDAATDDPYYWSDDRLLEEIVKSKDKELDFEMKIFEKTSDIDFDDEGSEENDEK